MSDNNLAQENISFYQGGEKINSKDCLESIKQKISELSNIKNINYLTGAGVSSGAIASMKKMQEEISNAASSSADEELKSLYSSIKSDNLEKTLNILYAKKHYLEGCVSKEGDDKKEEKAVEKLIEFIQRKMFSKINIDLSSSTATDVLNLHKKFYQKISLRNKDLARANIFTTNNDLFNEKALDNLNIDYNNGFGGGLERVFNPARFRYTFSTKIDANLEKFEPIENIVYLYKLHGSISWIEEEGWTSQSLLDTF